jgi:hypothetical protein
MDNIKQQIKDVIKTGDFGQYLPEFLFHATFSGTLDSIKKNGLGSLKSGYKSLWNLQYEQGVYLDTDASSAESFVEGSDDDRLDTESVIVFKIPTAKLDHSLLEVDWNNTWNTDIIEDGEFESLKDYFDSITYFYGGVIPFADLTVVKDLNEEQEESGIEAIAPTKENIIDAAKEEFGSGEDIPEGTPSYLLPDGSFIDMFSESEASEKSYLSSHYGWSHAQVDIFLKHAGLMSSASSEDLSITFENLTGSIAVNWSPYEGDASIFFNNNTPTSQQYEKILNFINNVILGKQELKIYTPKLGKINSSQLENKSAKEILDLIKQYYTTGKLGESILKEDIDHREVYKSLIFSDNPERGPIFISREGKFANIGRFVTHAKIFDGQDYDPYTRMLGDDYYALEDAYNLIKANSGNKFEPFAYIDLWKIPNPAQKKAIITWMYYLIEWGMYTLQVNTSSSNETYNLTIKIPEETYDDIVRSLLESKTEAVGHRNDDYFGDGQRSLLKVVVHETTELGNIDIPDTVLNTFKHTEEQGKLLKEFIELIDSGEAIEDFDNYIETLMDVIHGEYPEAKYALWLCKTKDDVKQYYGGTDSNIGTYKIEYPKPISDLGEEGLLYVFSKLPERING